MKPLFFSCVFTVIALLAASQQAHAQDDSGNAALSRRALAFEVGCCTAPPGWRRVGAAGLDSQRGGFDLPSGLTLSLGIDRLVTLNGNLVSQTSFNVANVASISGDEARQARDAIGGARLIQNGAGNFAAIPSVPGTYVQNTLNGQAIGTQTTINASVNSASLMKDLNFQAGVRDAGIRAIGIH